MLSNETRPVESIATDANGLPRWVEIRWPTSDGHRPQRALLLTVYEQAPCRGEALLYIPAERRARMVAAKCLHELPPEAPEADWERETYNPT